MAALSGSMDQLAELRGPMERLAALEAPMSRLAGIGVAARCVRPASIAVQLDWHWLGWGIVTFLAVRLAIVSAARRRGEATRELASIVPVNEPASILPSALFGSVRVDR